MTDWVVADVPTGGAACSRAAESLRAVADTLHAAVEFLDGPAAIPRDRFAGSSGGAYREAARSVRSDAATLRADLRALATGLDEYADRLASVRMVMVAAHRTAAEHRFPIDGPTIYRPAWALPDQDLAFQRIRAEVEGARADLEAAASAWAATLAGHTGVPPTPVDADRLAPLGPDRSAPVERPHPDAPGHDVRTPWPLPSPGPQSVAGPVAAPEVAPPPPAPSLTPSVPPVHRARACEAWVFLPGAAGDGDWDCGEVVR